MSAATVVNKPAQATKLVIFTARCEARAILYAACEFDLHEAVDVLQAHALASGLVDEIGQDAVQAIISEPLGRVR
jgi:predicted branched-subunit amino acid permease